MVTEHEPVLRGVDRVRKSGARWAHLVAAGQNEAANLELLILADEAERLAKLCRPAAATRE